MKVTGLGVGEGGIDVAVAVEVLVAVGVGVAVLVGVSDGVGVQVGVGVSVDVGVRVAVAVRVGVNVAAGIGGGVSVGLGVKVSVIDGDVLEVAVGSNATDVAVEVLPQPASNRTPSQTVSDFATSTRFILLPSSAGPTSERIRQQCLQLIVVQMQPASQGLWNYRINSKVVIDENGTLFQIVSTTRA